MAGDDRAAFFHGNFYGASEDAIFHDPFRSLRKPGDRCIYMRGGFSMYRPTTSKSLEVVML